MKIELQFETLEEYQSLVSSLSSLREREEFQEMLRSKAQAPILHDKNPLCFRPPVDFIGLFDWHVRLSKSGSPQSRRDR